MIIGITGHARHGKDTCADIIVRRFGYEKRAFAEPMKEACRLIFGWTDVHLYGALKEVVDPRWGISPRHALQGMGTEWGQFILAKFDQFAEVTGRRLWANSLLNSCAPNTVVCDVRFPHEVEAIHEHGGLVIRVVRPGLPVDLSHESESAMEAIEPDVTVQNIGSVYDLEYLLLGVIQAALS